ncbi:hypothetical protein CLOM_g12139 [Closterium sp. NIES-68]|nr:hypothetical protein CLOM_g12139 [Closterium sp. NIES-68]GJP61033.1 hypothetical protein CLOP_g18246 [Closterium sp. NIES-67]
MAAATFSSVRTAHLRLSRTVVARTALCRPACAVAAGGACGPAAPRRIAAAPSTSCSDDASTGLAVRRCCAAASLSMTARRNSAPSGGDGSALSSTILARAASAPANGAAHSTRRLRFSTIAAQASPGQAATAKESEDDTWQIKLLYDGDCPICMREVDFLQGRNQQHGTLKFVDIAAEGYSAEENAGVSYDAAMGQIHGIYRDGTVVTGVEAFRKFYEAVGLGWVYAITKFPPVGALADGVYELWAKYRLPLSGRPSLQAVIEERRQNKLGVQGCKEEEDCEIQF